MFNELPPERRAFCLTRMIYRDTEELEARHVEQGEMDMEFYGTMHGVVRRGLGSVLRYYALVDGLADEAGMFAAAGKISIGNSDPGIDHPTPSSEMRLISSLSLSSMRFSINPDSCY